MQTACREYVNSTPTNTARTELHSMITSLHANTRGSRAGRLRILHLCVPKTIVIRVSCLIPWRTWHWRQAQVLSNTHKIFGTRSICTLRSSTTEWRINTNPSSHRLWAQDYRDQDDRDQHDRDQFDRDRSDRVWRPRAQKNRAWQESWDRSVSNTGKIYEEVLLPKMWLNMEKLVLCM